MTTLASYLVLAALLGFATSILAEVVHWQPCSNDPSALVACTIHEVKVQPCREAPNAKPCRIRRGRSASISFDFTPNFSGGDLQSRAYWKSEVMDLPFLAMDSDACASTTCPATSGTRQIYNNTLPISESYSLRAYDVKWKLWNSEEKECCFIFQIKLVR